MLVVIVSVLYATTRLPQVHNKGYCNNTARCVVASVCVIRAYCIGHAAGTIR